MRGVTIKMDDKIKVKKEMLEFIKPQKIYIPLENKSGIKYKKLVNRLGDYLFLDDTGSYRLYAPTLVIVKEGKILSFDNETSLMTNPILPNEYWTEEKINSFKEKIGNYFDEYLGSTNSSL